MCEESFINQADAKGEWGWGGGGGGRRTGLRKVKAQITIVRGSPNRVTLMKFKGLLRYQKPHVTDNISFAYNVQYADSLYCCLYSNIRYNIQCRITNFLHCDVCIDIAPKKPRAIANFNKRMKVPNKRLMSCSLGILYSYLNSLIMIAHFWFIL